MTWANKYVGVPYVPKGRTLDGADCWGLVRLALAEEAGIKLPSYADLYSEADLKEQTDEAAKRSEVIAQKALALEWAPIDSYPLRPFDAMVYRFLGEPIHITLVVQFPLMLHAHWTKAGAVIEDYTRPHWVNKLEQCYRHKSLT